MKPAYFSVASFYFFWRGEGAWIKTGTNWMKRRKKKA